MSLLRDKFRGTPRPQQDDLLRTLEDRWDKHDVHVLRAPTGLGKSRVAAAIAEAYGPAVILTKDNNLVDQYERDFPDYAYLHRTNRYDSATDAGHMFRRARLGYQQHGGSPVSVMNYYTFLANRQNKGWLKPQTVIVDEAHTLIPFLEDLGTVKVWRHTVDYPDDLGGVEEYCGWLKEESIAALRKRLNEVGRDPDTYVVESTEDLWRGKVRDCLKFRPWLVRPATRFMFPWFVRKIVLLSATINELDIVNMGLDRRKVNYQEVGTPIGAFRRPITRHYVGPMNYSDRAHMIPRAAKCIEQLLDRHPQSGMIHATYDYAQKLRQCLDHPRLIWHNAANKERKYQEFLDTPGAVLVGSGLYEGIDLAEDLGRWQVVCQVPYPNLKDAVWHYKYTQFPELYNWQAVQAIEQASGRICRGPEDTGITYVLDSRLDYLLTGCRDMFSSSFLSALS